MINHANLWAEGKYVDLWSMPHILSGVIMGGVFNWLGFNFWLNLTVSAVLMISWEFFELYALDVHEHLSNKIMDVVTGLLGFFMMCSLINKYTLTPLIPYLVFFSAVYIFLNVWGYLAYEKRTGKIS